MYKSKNHSQFSLKAHLILVVKYQKEILIPPLSPCVKHKFQQIADKFDDNGIFVGDVEFPDNTILTIDVDFGLEAKMIDEEIEVEFLSKIEETLTNYVAPINIRVYPIINEISENKFKVKFYEDCGRFHFGHTTFNSMDAVKEYVSATVHQVKALYRL